MAEELFQIAIPTPGKAVADLRDFQQKAVRFDVGGVRPATTVPDSGAAYVLHNKPNSGQACTVVGVGNLTKAKAGDTILAGQDITFNSSQWFVPTSAAYATSSGAPLTVGRAFTGCTSGSVFSLYVTR